jgi:hypothetical protein
MPSPAKQDNHQYFRFPDCYFFNRNNCFGYVSSLLQQLIRSLVVWSKRLTLILGSYYLWPSHLGVAHGHMDVYQALSRNYFWNGKFWTSWTAKLAQDILKVQCFYLSWSNYKLHGSPDNLLQWFFISSIWIPNDFSELVYLHQLTVLFFVPPFVLGCVPYSHQQTATSLRRSLGHGSSHCGFDFEHGFLSRQYFWIKG